MSREPLDYALSMLLAPAVGALTGSTILAKAAATVTPASLTDLSVYCRNGAGEQCVLLSAGTGLLWSSAAVLIISIALPLACWMVIKWLSARRSALAEHFPAIVRGYLLLVALLLAAQSCVLLFCGYALVISGYFNQIALLLIGLLAVGLLSAAVAVIADLSRALEVEPVQVTAVALEEPRAPLTACVARVAERLALPPPPHIVLGLEPRFFITAAALRLRGEAELQDTVALYVSTPALRIFTASELDALIARELGALHAEPVTLSRQFVPMAASVAEVIAHVGFDSQRVGVMAKIARMSSNGFLAVLRSALHAAQGHVRVQRSQDADRAALQIVEPAVLISALAKAAALESRWCVFRRAYEHYMLRGHTRRNLALDYMNHLAHFVRLTDAAVLQNHLREAAVSELLGQSAQLAERAAAHAVSLDVILADLATQLGTAPPVDAELAALEECITTLENDYFRVPGRRAVLNTQDTLPAELAVA